MATRTNQKKNSQKDKGGRDPAVIRLENRIANDELRQEKTAKTIAELRKTVDSLKDKKVQIMKRSAKVEELPDIEDIGKPLKTEAFSGHDMNKNQMVLYKSPQEPTKHRQHQAAIQWLSRQKPCVQRYFDLLVHPFQRPLTPWCSIMADEAKVAQYTEYGKRAGQADGNGRAIIAINPYALFSDSRCVAMSNGNAIVDPIDLSNGVLFNYAACTSNPYTTTDGTYNLGVNDNPVHVRPVIASICISSADTALATKGVIYSACNPSGFPTIDWHWDGIRLNSNNPAGMFATGNCYPFVWTPPTEDLANFVTDQVLSSPNDRIRVSVGQSINGYGSTCILFLEGAAAFQSIFFEYALHYEVSPGLRFNQIPGTLKTSENHEKAAQVINQSLAAGQQKHITTTPEKGLFDRFIDGLASVGGVVADIGGKFFGAAAGEFVKTL